MGGLPLNRTKDFGNTQHDPILDFRSAIVDLDERTKRSSRQFCLVSITALAGDEGWNSEWKPFGVGLNTLG